MKKVLLITLVSGLALASCKKQYSCDCTTTSIDIFTEDQVVTSTTYTFESKKKEAEATCQAYKPASTVFDLFSAPVTTCVLK